MATGGTIPTNITQTVSFYNTTGVIEKDKNIYYVPRFSKISGISVGDSVRFAYLDAFEVVCPPSSAYKNMDISGWSPQDRSLVVQGNIDDFRLVTEEGACLNYFIIQRAVTKPNHVDHYLYGFFITGVEQVGGASVRITAVPDDFTNVFYLHNKHEFTLGEIGTDYEPFNQNLKNCYVRRQHYNRVKYDKSTVHHDETERVSFTAPEPSPIPIGLVRILYTASSGESIINFNYTIEAQSGSGTISLSVRHLVAGDEIVAIGTDIPAEETKSVIVHYWFDIENETTDVLVPDNMKVFLNQEDSFKFKYQYKDSKRLATSLSSEDYDDMMSKDFSELSEDEKFLLLKLSLSYLVIEAKSKDIGGYLRIDSNISSMQPYKYGGNFLYKNPFVKEQVKYSAPQYIIPFIDVPYELNKFKDNLMRYSIYLKVLYGRGQTDTYVLVNTFDSTYTNSSWFSQVMSYLHQNNIDNHIYNIYIVRDMGLDNFITLESGRLIFNVNSEVNMSQSDNPSMQKNWVKSENELYLVSFVIKGEDVKDKDGKNYNEVDNQSVTIQYMTENYAVLNNLGAMPALLKAGNNYIEKTVNLKETCPNPMSLYYDPVLEAEPYSFYSLSYLSYEMSLDKNRYIETGIVVYASVVTINGAVKMGILPIYTVEGSTQRYLNDGLIFTLSSQLPLSSDSYSNYYYQNMAQMKNQYAVNDYNRLVDLGQHFFVSGPNAVGMSASRRGYVGALSETGNQAMQMVDEGIDWAQSTKVIEMNQKAVLADMGRKPDSYSQTGSDIYYDICVSDNVVFLNHYTIDELSYNSIAKMLERIGYQVGLYDDLHVVDRVGWNYIQLINFDFNPAFDLMTSQEDTIRNIFAEGVTLIHDKSYLTSGHNYETILE